MRPTGGNSNGRAGGGHQMAGGGRPGGNNGMNGMRDMDGMRMDGMRMDGPRRVEPMHRPAPMHREHEPMHRPRAMARIQCMCGFVIEYDEGNIPMGAKYDVRCPRCGSFFMRKRM